MSTHITTEPEISSGIPKVLSELDMIPVSQSVQDSIFYPVMLDGKLLGKTIIKISILLHIYELHFVIY